MDLANCVGRLSVCIEKMLLSSGSAREKIQSIGLKQFMGLCAADFPPELAQDCTEIKDQLRKVLPTKNVSRVQFPFNNISQKDARRLIEKIFTLYCSVMYYRHTKQALRREK